MTKNLFFGLLNLVMWIFISSVFIFNGAIGVAVFTAIIGIIDSVIVICGDMEFISADLTLFTAIIFITVMAGLIVGNGVEKRRDHAVELYENGQYEEAMDGFMKVEGMYDTNDYLENVVRLKGTDVEVVK